MMSQRRRPHIIILNPDEMRASTLGHLGMDAGATPNLDEFAANDAVSFENAYCQNPVCVPSRCAAMTGLYPHVKGHRTMSYLLREGESSIFSELKNAGYQVWANSRNDLIAGQIDGLMAQHIDEEYIYIPPKNPNAGGRPPRASEEAFPYSHFEGVVDRAPNADMIDTMAAVDRIKSHNKEEPLCLFLGWLNPHTPYVCSKEHYDRIDASKIPERIPAEETRNKALILEKLRENNGMGSYSEKKWKELRHVYYGQCAYVDDMFRMVLDALKEAGMYEDSLIVFWSDHGDFTGDYGIPEKDQNSFEDCLVKVPFIIKPPKGEGADVGVTGSLAELIDLYATVLDYADVEAEHTCFGKSLRKVIENRDEKVREYAFCEGGRLPIEDHCSEYIEKNSIPGNPYYAREISQRDDEAHAKGTMITNGKFKYIKRYGGKDEFYDIEADPGERINLIPEGLSSIQKNKLNEMKAAMLDWYQETCDIVPKDFDGRFSDDKIYSFVAALINPEAEEEMKAYIKANHPGFGELFHQAFLLNQKY